MSNKLKNDLGYNFSCSTIDYSCFYMVLNLSNIFCLPLVKVLNLRQLGITKTRADVYHGDNYIFAIRSSDSFVALVV